MKLMKSASLLCQLNKHGSFHGVYFKGFQDYVIKTDICI